MIIAAAIKQDGVVYSLPKPNRHHNIINHMVVECGLPIPINGEQGFITDKNEFVDRFDGGVIAIECGQIEKLNWPSRLFSEDLW